MTEGASSVRLNGADIKIKTKVEVLDGWSAHADRDGLLKFASYFAPPPHKATEGHSEATQDTGSKHKTVFCALGEPSAERFLAQRIHDYLGARAVVPEYGETWEITHGIARRV
jgi:metallo-beta-lactamase family protein